MATVNNDIFQASSDQSFWGELVDFVNPFISIGNEIFSFASIFQGNNDQNAAIQEFSQKLNEISGEIHQLKDTILEKINDTSLKERAGEVLGIRDSLNSFLALHSFGILDNLITDSATTKEKIISYLKDSQTPIEYYYSYNTLLCILQPLRIIAIFLYWKPLLEIRPLLLNELNDFLSFKDKGINIAETVGRNRVVYLEKTVLFEAENPPIWSTQFRILIDNKGVYNDRFVPPPYSVPPQDLGQKEALAKSKYAEFSNRKAEEVSKDIRISYDNAQKLLNWL